MMINSMGIVPAASPPDGVVANFDDPQDGYYPAALATKIVCAVLVNVFFLVHAYVKLVVKTARLQQEDWFCIASWLFVNGFFVLLLGMSYYGEGRMIWEVTRGDYRNFLKFVYLSTAFYSPAAFCTKVTLLLLIARVFHVHPPIAKAIRVFIVLIFLVYLPLVLLKIFICKPISAYWQNYDTDGNGMATGQNSNCRGQGPLFMGDIMVSVVTDVIILILPIPMAWRMEAPLRQKIKIVILLGAGGAATVTTVVRAWMNMKFMHSTNTTLDLALISTTSALEVSVGLLCACLPSANLLFEKWRMPKLEFSSPQGRLEKTPRPGPITMRTTSTYWSSIKSMIAVPTMRTVTQRPDNASQTSRRRSCSDDPESGNRMDHVVFNNRLDMPSIGSTTDDEPRFSREEDHRGIEDAVDEVTESKMTTNKDTSDDLISRKDSVIEDGVFIPMRV